MEKYRRQKMIIIIALIITIAGLSIGFAAFSEIFKISSTASVTPNASTFSVKFSTKQDSLDESEIVASSVTDGLEYTNGVIDNSGSPTASNMSATFTTPGQYVEYTFYARNEGEYKAYLNNVNFVGTKICAGVEGATDSLVQSACESINMTVTVGDSTYSQTTAIMGHALEKDAGEKVIVNISYASDGAMADGEFSVDFGKIRMVYSTIDDSIFAPPLSESNPVLMTSLLSESSFNLDAGVDYGIAPASGVYLVSSTVHDTNPIYYYRGAVTNNNVLFAELCWKIVRTTDTGGVKLIYNGTATDDGQCNGTSPTIGTSKFNENSSSIDDVRYVYADGTNSTVKGVVDTWYASNMTTYTSQLEDIPWCNDRSVISTNEYNTYFGAYDRLITNKSPSLDCESDYQLTVSSTDTDKHLLYPVALLTADEYALAGSGTGSNYSTTAYLYTGSSQWSLSPSNINSNGVYGFYLYSSGQLGNNNNLTYTRGVRPSVSLQPGTNVIGGDGSTSKPYIVE